MSYVREIFVLCMMIALYAWLKPESKYESLQTNRHLPERRWNLPQRPVLEKIPQNVQTSKFEKPAPSPLCNTLWNQLYRANLSNPNHDYLPFDFLANVDGCQAVPKQYNRAHGAFLSACLEYRDALKEELPYEALAQKEFLCRHKAGFYRIEISAKMHQTKSLSEINDLKVLSELLVARLRGEIPTAVEVSERILEVDPFHYPAAKMALMARLYLLTPSNISPTDPRWKDIVMALDRAKEIKGPDDRQLAEVQMAVNLMRQENLSQVRERAHRWTERDQLASFGFYYLAWVEAVNGNKKAAMYQLKRAVSYPGAIPRFKKTLKAMRKKQYGERLDDIFESSLFYDMDHLSL